MTNAPPENQPVTKADCLRHHTSVRKSLDDLTDCVKTRVSWRYYAVTCAAAGLLLLLIVKWQFSQDANAARIEREQRKIDKIESKVDFIRGDQEKVQTKLDATHSAVIELKTLIKKNGNH